MESADQARTAGDAAAACTLIEDELARIDPSADGVGLAQFTLARLYDDALDRPAQAAEAARAALSADLPAALRPAAYLRAIGGFRRAGASERAADWARRYLARYPNGRDHQRIATWLQGQEASTSEQ